MQADPTILTIALGIVSCLGGWLMKIIFSELDALRKLAAQQAKDLTEFRVKLAESYVAWPDLYHELQEIKQLIKRDASRL